MHVDNDNIDNNLVDDHYVDHDHVNDHDDSSARTLPSR